MKKKHKCVHCPYCCPVCNPWNFAKLFRCKSCGFITERKKHANEHTIETGHLDFEKIDGRITYTKEDLEKIEDLKDLPHGVREKLPSD